MLSRVPWALAQISCYCKTRRKRSIEWPPKSEIRLSRHVEQRRTFDGNRELTMHTDYRWLIGSSRDQNWLIVCVQQATKMWVPINLQQWTTDVNVSYACRPMRPSVQLPSDLGADGKLGLLAQQRFGYSLQSALEPLLELYQTRTLDMRHFLNVLTSGDLWPPGFWTQNPHTGYSYSEECRVNQFFCVGLYLFVLEL